MPTRKPHIWIYFNPVSLLYAAKSLNKYDSSDETPSFNFSRIHDLKQVFPLRLPGAFLLRVVDINFYTASHFDKGKWLSSHLRELKSLANNNKHEDEVA